LHFVMEDRKKNKELFLKRFLDSQRKERESFLEKQRPSFRSLLLGDLFMELCVRITKSLYLDHRNFVIRSQIVCILITRTLYFYHKKNVFGSLELCVFITKTLYSDQKNFVF
jgi:hypothetical protein